MENHAFRKQPDKQKKYRNKQIQKGLVRYEIQIKEETKQRIEQMVTAIAEEYDSPWDPRRRLARARNEVFEKITQDTTHDFIHLKEQNEQLKKEIAALSPTYFTSSAHVPTSLPAAVNSLPDDCAQLKSIIAQLFHDLQQSKHTAQKLKTSTDRFEKLYEASTNYNERLLYKLRECGVHFTE